MRQRLRAAARAIHAHFGKPPSGPWKALSKLFVAPRFQSKGAVSKRVGWKPGELWEFFTASSITERREEWGDVGYYVAQTWVWLWWLYAIVTPRSIVARAVEKYEARAKTTQRR